ncbi:MAG: 3D domain-containing protein [Terricaulis sp.]
MIKTAPDAARGALNADPSYVFFQEENITDPSAGPRGASGAPLTPLGSIAVDPDYHPYGAIVFVDGTYDGAPFQRLLVAQDTGGAIRRGPFRGDVFFGSGPQAGAGAEAHEWPRALVDLAAARCSDCVQHECVEPAKLAAQLCCVLASVSPNLSHITRTWF